MASGKSMNRLHGDTALLVSAAPPKARARTVSQSSSSAVPASTSSTRRRISLLQAADAWASSDSKLWISSCAGTLKNYP